MYSLAAAWRATSFDSPPYIFAGDQILLDDAQVSRDKVAVHSGFNDFINAGHLDWQKNQAVHLGLLPVPYVGSLKKASIFFLLLNPGFEPDDYFGESEVPGFREALLRNLRQENEADDYPFFGLNPAFAWHSGYRYWERKLGWLAREVAKQHDTDYRSGLKLVSQHVCACQLVPYHSTRYSLSERIEEGLASRRAIIDFARDELGKRAAADQASIVVMRAAGAWGLTEDRNTVVYRGSQTRAAHLTAESQAGMLVKRRLGLE